MSSHPRKVTLRSIFQKFPLPYLSSIPNVSITGVVSDSRQVQPGDLFVALAGASVDGHRFIPDAIQQGAVAVVGMESLYDLPVPYIMVEDSRVALAHLAAGYYEYPAHKLVMIGVTGTDGKTTTANLLFNILKAAGISVGMISTVNAVIGDTELDTGFHVTTPDAPDVQHYLAMMVDAGMTHVVLVTTSHGLAQARVEACDFDISVITNITHEHLDYHGSYAAYQAAKARLFTQLAVSAPKKYSIPRTGILNLDDASYEYLSSVTQAAQLSYGRHPQANVRAEGVEYQPEGLSFQAVGTDFSFPIFSRLVGDYNVSNCLAAIATTVGVLGLEPAAAQAGIAALRGVPGRMERIDLGQAFVAIVDFAHTPNALRRALETVRRITAGRVIAVFGSAGLRDRAKRRMMAEVSGELADLTILTAEDPRSEPLEAILEEMAGGIQAGGGVEGATYWRIPDRGDAIRYALSLARPGDLVIACGKGHEQSMCFGTQEYAWDDRIAMRSALAELLQVQGPEMPSLPTQSQL
jgi:UDP-N-acetylmuramoyl-L-alanyl-D-glutamate--2,6-diaminopimelate ligase